MGDILLLLHGCNYHTVAYDTREGGGGEQLGGLGVYGVEILCWTLKDDVLVPKARPFHVVETRPELVRMDHSNEWIYCEEESVCE